MIKVARSLYRELMKIVTESGSVDIQDVPAVLEHARTHGLVAASKAVQGNPRRYLRCISEGMEATDY